MLDSTTFIFRPVCVLSIVLEDLRRIEDTPFDTSEVILDFEVPFVEFFIVFEFENQIGNTVEPFIWIGDFATLEIPDSSLVFSEIFGQTGFMTQTCG